MVDPLVMDVISDDRTLALGRGVFVRCGVEYVFTAQEIDDAVNLCFDKLIEFTKAKGY